MTREDKAMLMAKAYDDMLLAVSYNYDADNPNVLRVNTRKHIEGDFEPSYYNHFTTLSRGAYEAIFQTIDRLRANNNARECTFLDLGCGVGIVGTIVKYVTGAYAIGYDINALYVRIAKYFGNRAYVKDITRLRKQDVESADIIYFWDPLICPKLCEKFTKKITTIAQPGQFIIHYASQMHLRKPLVEKLDDTWELIRPGGIAVPFASANEIELFNSVLTIRKK